MSDAGGHLVIPDAPEGGFRTKSVEERMGQKAPLRGASQAPERELPLPGVDGQPPKNGKGDELLPEVAQEIDALKQRTEASDRAAAEANRRALEAENARREALAQTQKAHETAIGAELDSVTRRVDALKGRRQSLRSELVAASGDLNHQRVAEITDELADIAAEQRELERNKTAIEAQKAEKLSPQPATAQKQYASFGAAVADNPEGFIRERTPRTQEWLRAHPDALKDAATVDQLVAAHNLAVAKKLVPDTDAYFAYIEGAIGGNEDGGTRPAPKREAQPRKAPAAPPSRDSGPMVNGKSVNLRAGDRYYPPGMLEFIDRMFPEKTPEAQQKTRESYYDEYVRDVQSGAIQDRWGVAR